MARILVTDDDKHCRESMLTTLARGGHDMEEACDVDGAIDAMSRQEFDLVICDYRMPGKTGLDLLNYLSNTSSRTPVLLISATADAQTESTAIGMGAVGLLRKPFRRHQLLEYATLAEELRRQK